MGEKYVKDGNNHKIKVSDLGSEAVKIDLLENTRLDDSQKIHGHITTVNILDRDGSVLEAQAVYDRPTNQPMQL